MFTKKYRLVFLLPRFLFGLWSLVIKIFDLLLFYSPMKWSLWKTFWWSTDTEEISTRLQQKLTFSSWFVLDSWHRVLSWSFFYNSPSFSNNCFAFKLSSPQPWDRGSLLTAGSEAGALIQCLLNSMGFSQCQKVLDQGWRGWKTLTRYGVWSQEIK